MKMSKEEKSLVEKKIQELLRKGAITHTNHRKNEFVDNAFLRKKKDGRYRSAINLKLLNQFLEYYHFKTESLNPVI